MQQEKVEGRFVSIATGIAAANGVPSLATHGIAVPINRRGKNCIVKLRHTAAGARTITAKIWGYDAGEIDTTGAAVTSSACWCDLNETITMASTSTNGGYCKRYEALTAFSRLYVEITAVTGSPTIATSICFTDE